MSPPYWLAAAVVRRGPVIRLGGRPGCLLTSTPNDVAADGRRHRSQIHAKSRQVPTRDPFWSAYWHAQLLGANNGVVIPLQASSDRTRCFWRSDASSLSVGHGLAVGVGMAFRCSLPVRLLLDDRWRVRDAGVFLINAARNPQANLSLIWFTVCSSVVHAAIMAVQSFGSGHHMGHLWGDVLALLLVAIVLSVLVLSSGLKQAPPDRLTDQVAAGQV